MSRDEFKLYIESIGFRYHGSYKYKKYRIHMNLNNYIFNSGGKWFTYDYNDLRPLKQITRSIKLKKILE